MSKMKARQGRSSFCEQKEAKKLPQFVAVGSGLPTGHANGQELSKSFFGSFCSQKELIASLGSDQ
ncbi:MAG: hypothetical protein H7251_10115 [Acetobacteraceae bacterium]|nr:hypothetical protein [Acetobacteraceae bacterium]